MANTVSSIVLPSGGYRKLNSYKKSEVIYQGTVVFCRRFLPPRGDRTVDQMVQAARSCKQNIAEGSAASGTSRETEIKLTGVARATLDELLEDYKDYLTRHGLSEWSMNDPRKAKMRAWAKTHNAWADYSKGFETRDAETLCNLMMTVIHQEHVLLDGMLAHQEADFKEHGGIRERMAKARHEARSDGLASAIYSRLQGAGSARELEALVRQICQETHRISETLKKKRKW